MTDHDHAPPTFARRDCVKCGHKGVALTVAYEDDRLIRLPDGGFVIVGPVDAYFSCPACQHVEAGTMTGIEACEHGGLLAAEWEAAT